VLYCSSAAAIMSFSCRQEMKLIVRVMTGREGDIREV